MLRAKRLSIAGLMGVVLIVSFGLAILRQATEATAGLMFLATCGVLALTVVGLACRARSERAWWLGCALFGWGYLALAFWSSHLVPQLPTMALAETLMARAGAPLPPSGPGPMGVDFVPPSRLVGHCLWALALAALGGALAHAFFGPATDREAGARTVRHAPCRVAGRGWIRAGAISLAASLLIATAVLFAAGWAPAFWTGIALLLTCGVIGTAVLGAASNRGPRRVRWLGAALFGSGYMLLIFGPDAYMPSWPHRAVDNTLQAVCPWLPPSEPGVPASSPQIAAANARIRKALEQPVTLHFPLETPLAEFVDTIRARTPLEDGSRLPIYVDPVGLQEVEKDMHSQVRIDIEGVPLKTALSLALRQIGMIYDIKEGVLEVNSMGCRDFPYLEDPALSAGHCLLALLAAGVGSLAAPLVSGPHDDRTAADGGQEA